MDFSIGDPVQPANRRQRPRHGGDLIQLGDDLRRLLDLLIEDVALQSAAMDAGRVTVDQWQQQMAQSLLAAHYAGYGTGRGATRFTPQEEARITRIVGEQLDYLNRFAAELDTRAWTAADAARALLYMGNVKSVFWAGRTFGWDLPYMPASGTACLGNCGCRWEGENLDEEELTGTWRWVRGKSDSCPTCVQREAAGPIRFISGERV